MRLMSLISLLVASIIAFIGLHKNADLGSLSTLCGVFLGAGFVGKAGQKFAENKPTQPPQSTTTTAERLAGLQPTATGVVIKSTTVDNPDAK